MPRLGIYEADADWFIVAVNGEYAGDIHKQEESWCYEGPFGEFELDERTLKAAKQDLERGDVSAIADLIKYEGWIRE